MFQPDRESESSVAVVSWSRYTSAPPRMVTTNEGAVKGVRGVEGWKV